MSIKFRLSPAMIAFIYGVFVAYASVIGISAAKADTMPPADCPVCQTIPATKTETVNQTTQQTTQQNTSTSTKTVESKSVKAKIRHYEQSKNVIVAVHMRAGGVKSKKGCIDPTKPVKDKNGKKSKPWIKVGQPFTNTRKNGSPFTDTWEASFRIKNPHRVHVGNHWYMKGDKCDCGNKDILIPIQGPKIKHQTRKVEVFKSYKEFLTVYNKWITTTNTTNSSTTNTTTPSVTVKYSCAEGWTLVESGDTHNCTKCEHQQCTNCPQGSTWNGTKCVKDGSTTPDPPTGSGGTNPPSTGTGTACKWDHAGTYNGHTHASGDDVSDADMTYAGGQPPDTSCV